MHIKIPLTKQPSASVHLFLGCKFFPHFLWLASSCNLFLKIWDNGMWSALVVSLDADMTVLASWQVKLVKMDVISHHLLEKPLLSYRFFLLTSILTSSSTIIGEVFPIKDQEIIFLLPFELFFCWKKKKIFLKE